jgi:group I intron endonuclease
MITYTATNNRTGQFYIGSTTNFKKRQQEHLNSCSPYPFQRSLRKNPEEWVWEWVEDDCEERELEQFLLDLFWGDPLCLNLAPDVIAPRKGQTQSEETKRKIGDKHRGKKYGPETRAKISRARKGSPSPLKGRKFPGRQKGALNSRSKRVEVTFPSGEIKVFAFAAEAAEKLVCSKSTLQKWCQTEKPPCRGAFFGYKFRYL